MCHSSNRFARFFFFGDKQSSESSILPHLLVLGSFLVLLGVGFATNSGAIGRFIGATAASVMDPINLLVASILGGIVLRHWMLFGILVFFGTSLSVIISIKNAHLGSILDFELVSAKVAAALLIGYVVNFVRILARR